jgi:hypothetical protein
MEFSRSRASDPSLPRPAGGRLQARRSPAGDVLLLGRKTYEGFAAAWLSMTDETGFADKMKQHAYLRGLVDVADG